MMNLALSRKRRQAFGEPVKKITADFPKSLYLQIAHHAHAQNETVAEVLRQCAEYGLPMLQNHSSISENTQICQ